ncbi:MAG: BPL-N domain-containing protein [Bacteroidota bacterium]|nr:BPL-N domain-containing protein [Bacteroidota bacterium]
MKQNKKSTMKKITYILAIIFSLFIISCNTADFQNTEKNSSKIIVGVYTGNGASAICILETLEALKIDTGIAGKEISSADIMGGELDNIDVLIFPGGSGSKELNNLGDFGLKKVHDFVKNQGKGIVGICAGGYILSTTPNYPSLKLLDAYNFDRAHYARGRGLIEFQITNYEIFPELKDKKTFIQYYDGPILVPIDSNNIKYNEVAKYTTDIHSNKGIPTGITPGKTFMLTQNVGKGMIFTIGGHPESTPGMRWIVPRMARYVHSQEIIPYPEKWIKPEINSDEIMFTSELKKVERKLWWKLSNDTAQVQINAMQELFKLRSRPAVRWTIGLLRDDNPKVRKQAAIILMKTEYTWALKDVLQAIENEEYEDVKIELEKTADFLSTF